MAVDDGLGLSTETFPAASPLREWVEALAESRDAQAGGSAEAEEESPGPMPALVKDMTAVDAAL
eukprot:scaffold298649_cov29-Prasinocladus_malaysianus.AAC.3